MIFLTKVKVYPFLERFKIRIILAIVWLLLIFIINPLGNFPLNDDWAYSKNVLHLVDDGQIKLSDWPAMTLIAQMFWGALFCLPFGFSFIALRISTIILGYIGIYVSYLIFFKTTNNRRLSLLGSLLIAINPLYLLLSNTFMTDIPYFTVSMLSVWFFIRVLDSERTKDILLAILFSVLAVLIRQIGIFIPIAFGIAFIAKKNFTFKGLLYIILPSVAVISTLFLYNRWLSISSNVPYSYGQIDQLLDFIQMRFGKILKISVIRGDTYFTYLGLFFLPLLIITFQSKWRSLSLRNKIVSTVGSLSIMIPVIIFKLKAESTFPLGNIIYDLGLGPKLLRDTYILNINISPSISITAWNIIWIIGVIGATLLLIYLISSIFRLRRIFSKLKPSNSLIYSIFLMVYIHEYLVFTIIIPSHFDRYAIPFFLILVFIITEKGLHFNFRKIVHIVSLSFFLIIFFFSVAATHDYLAWNRARWKALNFLMKEKNISPHYIDGGFEFNGWYLPGVYYVSDERSWWWVDRDDYLISFGPMDGYNQFREFQYNQYLTFRKKSIYILLKEQQN